MPLAPPVIKIVLLVSFIIKYLGGQSARERRCGLDSKPFINQVRFDFPRKRSGHESVQDAVQPAGNDFGAVLPMPDDAPVMSAQGPKKFLSMLSFVFIIQFLRVD